MRLSMPWLRPIRTNAVQIRRPTPRSSNGQARRPDEGSGRKISKTLKDKGFVVFHDAYQNFENRFGVKAVGSITVSPEVMPGAKRVK